MLPLTTHLPAPPVSIALAADVHDIEPLPLDDSLLGRHNVVHTPHIAGRAMDANKQWAEMLAAQFQPS